MVEAGFTRSFDEFLGKAGEFPGYTLDEVVHRGSKSTVARAHRAADGCPVILKILSDTDPDRRRVAVLRHERAVANRVASDGVVRALGLESFHGRVALVLEDFGGISLKHYLDRSGKLPPDVFLEIAVQLCAALAEIHKHGIIHKDLKPHNILINPEGVVKITDFSISSILANEMTVPTSPRELEGTLPYMAPEQTGRMNRGLDQRADFYSLGVTFYELLSGRRPFTQADPLELVHAHIAVLPTPLCVLDGSIPRGLSRIVDKLLAKNPEDRYQSALGLRADIVECRRQIRELGRIADDFLPGGQDHPDTLQLPQRLYGRDAEVKTLLEAFERASHGAAKLLLVSGYAGVGKSALVNEVHKDLTRRRGHFVAGKFDQLSRSTPFAPVAQAVRELVRQILSETPEALEEWREKLETAVAGNGGVLTDLIPELALIMGPQPAVPELGPGEAQNRFALVFQNFIRVFATDDHPLVIFLDDLQWVDPASLKLLQLLLTDPSSGYLLVIGAYRDNEVPGTHPLALAVGELRRGGASVAEVALAPLDLANVERLVVDALSDEPSHTRDLAAYVFEKTHGNPFFVNQFLRTLRKEKLLTRDAASGRWTWDLKGIEAARVTDNVVEFMAARLRQLPPETRSILRLAACIGYQFDLRTLAIIREASINDTAAALWEALREGFVLPLNADYRFLHTEDEERQDSTPPSGGSFHVGYKFLHDRVQQAAYSLIEEAQKQEVHLRIGRLLLAKYGGHPRDDEMFDVVNHLNLGAACITQNAERQRLARLNLNAARKAKAATAYDAAADYLRTGMWLLDKCADAADGGWSLDYELAFALHITRAECEHLTGRFGEAERLFDVISARVKTDDERAQVQNLRMILCLTLGKFAEAIAAGRAGLALFGIELPEGEPEKKAALDAELARVDAHLAGRPIASLIDAPALTDPRALTISTLMTNLSPAAYFVNPTLFGLVGAKQVNLALQHGHTNASAYGYVAYGMFLTGVLGRYREAYEFGTLALELNERAPNNELTCKVNVLFAAFMNFFGKPLRSGHQPLSRAYAAGMQAGDFVYLSYACDQILFIRLGAGDELSIVREEIDKFLELMHRTKHTLSVELQTIMKQMVANLQGLTKGRHTLSDASFEEAGYAERLQASGLGFAASWYYVVKLELLYLHGDYAAALAMGLEAQKRIGSGGVYFTTELPFYLGLTCAALYETSTPDEKERLLATLEQVGTKLGVWAEQCADNFRHKHLLVAAERARIAGEDGPALDLYERAIEAAHDAGFLHHEAMASELLGSFQLARGRRRAAYHHLTDAYRCYLRWGATAKTADLAAKHRGIAILDPLTTSSTADITVTTRNASSVIGNPGLDLTSVIKASHVIAREIELEPLLAKVLQIVVENAGAERGVLLLESGGRVDVVAEHDTKGGGTVVRSEPLDDTALVPRSLVFLTQRLGSAVVLSDAEHEGAFTQDPYVLSRKPRSVMCVPILRHGEAFGSIYLENNLVTGAFTPDRLEVLRLLAAEIAISIVNARLYSGLKETLDHVSRLNEAYRRFVPHEMLTLLAKKSVVDLKLGDYVQREMSVLFADIRSFTSMSEAMSPRETFEFVNRYLEMMGPLIRKNGGYIDKYIGDAIMALFPEAPDDALASAVAMQLRLRELNRAREQDGHAPIAIRIGVHVGSVILGTVGEHERLEGTVISDTVNLAVRLEGLCERFGAGVIVSGEVLARSRDRDRFARRFLGSVKVKGKERPVDAFEVFGVDTPDLAAQKSETKDEFERGVHCLSQDDPTGAIACFRNVLKHSPEDVATRYLLGQAAEKLKHVGSSLI